MRHRIMSRLSSSLHMTVGCVGDEASPLPLLFLNSSQTYFITKQVLARVMVTPNWFPIPWEEIVTQKAIGKIPKNIYE